MLICKSRVYIFETTLGIKFESAVVTNFEKNTLRKLLHVRMMQRRYDELTQIKLRLHMQISI